MTISSPLDFELPLVQLENKIEELKDKIAGGDKSFVDEHARLEKQAAKLRVEIYGKLTPYQRVQLSRHFDRPFTLDYIKYIASDFCELHGDRLFRDDPAIVCGTAKIGQQPVMIVGHQRGRSTQERIHRNFGMPQPEGYRKALRMFRLAEKFALPVICLIDTQGAFPGMEAEERGQAEAIARNLSELSELSVPVLSIVIGEGGSGGALALGLTDKILMMENACYSVITPEGCASILWHGDRTESAQTYSALAAEALKLTAKDLKELGVIDEVIAEPLGGAHRNYKEAAENLQAAIVRNLEQLSKLTVKELLDKRYDKYRKLGPVTGED